MTLAADFRALSAALLPLRLGRRAFLLTDRNVAPLHSRAAVAALRRAGLAVSGAVIPAGERQKSLGRLAWVLDRVAAHGLERGDTLVALGGGVIGDLGGFAAATYMRGIAFIQLPTSLLAMVDAAIGGKVGVNLPRGKNLAGAFHQPRLVYAALDTLGTLPARELRSGLAEVIKAAMIGDARLFAELENGIAGVLALNPAAVRRAVAGAVRLKARIVASDERESDGRAILNYGHTVGHAIESATGYRRFRHGEAVALGMVAAGHLALALGVADREAIGRQNELLARAGLPLRARHLPIPAILHNLRLDKKLHRGRLRVVLTPRVGFASVREQPLDSHFERAIYSISIG